MEYLFFISVQVYIPALIFEEFLFKARQSQPKGQRAFEMLFQTMGVHHYFFFFGKRTQTLLWAVSRSHVHKSQ